MDLHSLHDVPNSQNLYTTYLDKICEEFEFDDAAYAGVNPVSGSMHAFVTYSEDWQDHYQKNNLHTVDPTLHSAMRSVAPLDWSRLRRDKNFDAVFKDARDFGICDRGMTIPIRGPYGEFGMLSVTRDCKQKTWDKLKAKVLAELQPVAAHVHDHVMNTEPLTRLLKSPSLSKRELEILQWIAAGKSQQDIGDILSISSRTVEVHIRSVRQKLFALTTAQAVGRAIGIGLIYPG
ncbi:LuxR family transcriptional regulator [Cognatishimia sp. WU-CL00825]|uniref:LuxR family transcriptional regulator n=1 Tax=Cognatishimia sp. WU-CL00825 TaxID=3127658 RepID=UPI003105D582